MGIIWPFGQVGQATLPFFVGTMHDSAGNYNLALAVVFAIGMAGAVCIALLPSRRLLRTGFSDDRGSATA